MKFSFPFLHIFVVLETLFRHVRECFPLQRANDGKAHILFSPCFLSLCTVHTTSLVGPKSDLIIIMLVP
jgi:hypothetical protein